MFEQLTKDELLYLNKNLIALRSLSAQTARQQFPMSVEDADSFVNELASKLHRMWLVEDVADQFAAMQGWN